MLRRLYELKKIQDDFGVLMSFAGPFSQGLIEEFGDTTKAYIDFEIGNKSRNHNIFSVYIEQAQNIKKYIESKLESPEIYNKINKSGIITISKKGQFFSVSSGNLILHQDAIILKEHLDRIKKLDKTELKELYRIQILKNSNSKDNSAGLGFIDMARKSSREIEFAFKKLDDTFSFFCLEILV